MQTRESVVCDFRSLLMCEEGRLRAAVECRGGALRLYSWVGIACAQRE
jgi:hypothetical protein